jgi:hypothetical protein
MQLMVSRNLRYLIALVVCAGISAVCGFEGGLTWSLWDIPGVIFGGAALAILNEFGPGEGRSKKD